MFLLRPGVWHDVGASGAGARVRATVGWRILVPGAAQWSWRQPERALVLFGSFAAAGVVVVLSWGTWTSALVLAFAFATHVVSALDVVRQSAFPGFGRWMPVASISGGLALGVYAPALSLAALTAWPVTVPGAPGDGYLVNCWAYRAQEPERNEWVWHRPNPWSEPKIGRVIAQAGDEVEWSRQGFRINGEKHSQGRPYRSSVPPGEMAYQVPEGHLLILPDAPGRDGESDQRVVLVAREQVKGRAWARLYPVWERRLLR